MCQPYQPTFTPVNTMTRYNLFSPLESILRTTHNAHEHEFFLASPANEEALTYNVGGLPVHSMNKAVVACCGITVQTDKERYLAPAELYQKAEIKKRRIFNKASISTQEIECTCQWLNAQSNKKAVR